MDPTPSGRHGLMRTRWLHFCGVRLGKRLRSWSSGWAGAVGASLPLACQDWANTKAAYRFFANERVSEAPILAGHFDRHPQPAASGRSDPFLHDTTEFTYQRERSEAIGITKSVNSGKDRRGRLRHHTVCGMLMHSSLAVTIEGLPLGLAAVKFWTRKKFKGTAALKRKINPTRVPIEKKESIRWLENLRQSTALSATRRAASMSVTGRATSMSCSATARSSERTSSCGPASTGWPGDGGHTIADEMEERDQGCTGSTCAMPGTSAGRLEIKYKRITVLPPIGKQKHYPRLS